MTWVPPPPPPPAALSQPAYPSYPGERRARDPWLDLMEKAAATHWRARGVKVGNVPIDVASNVGGDAIAGRGGYGRVILSDRQVGTLLARARSSNRTTRERRRAFQALGRTVAHELGHVGGLSHSGSGLMAPDADVSAAPWEIVHLSRELIRRNPRRDARLGRVAGGGFRGGG